MELEQNSEFEGGPLPFFGLIPGSGSFWFTRIVLEPAFVLLSAIVLGHIFIFQSGLVTYLIIAALALAMKSFIQWFRAWAYIRAILDMQYVGPIIAKMAQQQETEDDMAQIHLASFPKNVAPEIRDSFISHIARAFSPGAEHSNASTPAR